MTIDIKPDPASIRPGIPTVDTPSGPKPSGVLDEDAYTAGTYDAGAGFRAFGPIDRKHYYNELLNSESWPDGGGGITTMHPQDAAQVALAHVISRMTWQSKRLSEQRDASGQLVPPDLTVHRITDIYFDWPRWDGRDIPVSKALITAPEEARWEPGARTSLLLDNTIDVFAPDTMLRHLGEWEIPLRLIVWFAHQDVRRGFQARLSAVLAAERARETWHRVVVVPEYFDRDVTLMMQTISRPDSGDQAQANRWPLEFTIMASIEEVDLVRVPGYVVEASTGVEVDGQG